MTWPETRGRTAAFEDCDGDGGGRGAKPVDQGSGTVYVVARN